MGWGCGIPEPLGICVAGYPDTSLRPRSMWSHPWANVAGHPDCLAHRPRVTRAIHIEVYGAGPDRAEARIESTVRCRGIPGHRLMHGHGLTGLCMRFRYHPGTEDPKTTTTTIKPPSPLKSPIGGPPVHLRREVLYPPVGDYGSWAFRESHDHECRGGSCSREHEQY
jgi:hypothetical protein